MTSNVDLWWRLRDHRLGGATPLRDIINFFGEMVRVPKSAIASAGCNTNSIGIVVCILAQNSLIS